jgi:Domain of unknown function (DUF397)
MIVNGMPATELGEVEWIKSARSNSSGNCVEFARLGAGQVGVRDSKDPDGPALVFGAGEVAGFIRALKGGAHDELVRQG